MRALEIRTFRLKPGNGQEFLKTYIAECVPLLASAKMDLVAYGPSQIDPDSFIVFRAFDSFEHSQSTQDEFYASDAWRLGPRERIIAMYEDYHDVTMMVEENLIEAIRAGFPRL